MPKSCVMARSKVMLCVRLALLLGVLALALYILRPARVLRGECSSLQDVPAVPEPVKRLRCQGKVWFGRSDAFLSHEVVVMTHVASDDLERFLANYDINLEVLYSSPPQELGVAMLPNGAPIPATSDWRMAAGQLVSIGYCRICYSQQTSVLILRISER